LVFPLPTLPPPHVFGLPYPDSPWLVGLHNLSDFVIGVSYVAISATLAWLVRRARRAIPFSWMFLAFGAFILGCGISHFMHVVTVWRPQYWILLAVAQAVTVLASLVTAALLPPLMPKALALLESARLSEQRKGQLERANAALHAQIVERAHAGAALAASEARFRGTFDHAAVGMALLAPDGRWLQGNGAFHALVGYGEGKLRHLSFGDLAHPDDPDTDLEQVRRLLAGKVTTCQLETRFRHKDGHPIWALLGGSLVPGGQGAPAYAIVQLQDITARRHARPRHRVTHSGHIAGRWNGG